MNLFKLLKSNELEPKNLCYDHEYYLECETVETFWKMKYQYTFISWFVIVNIF